MNLKRHIHMLRHTAALISHSDKQHTNTDVALGSRCTSSEHNSAEATRGELFCRTPINASTSNPATPCWLCRSINSMYDGACCCYLLVEQFSVSGSEPLYFVYVEFRHMGEIPIEYFELILSLIAAESAAKPLLRAFWNLSVLCGSAEYCVRVP